MEKDQWGYPIATNDAKAAKALDQTISRWYVILPDVLLFESGFQNITIGVLRITGHTHASTSKYFLAA